MSAIACRVRSDVASARQMGGILLTRMRGGIRSASFAAVCMAITAKRAGKNSHARLGIVPESCAVHGLGGTRAMEYNWRET